MAEISDSGGVWVGRLVLALLAVLGLAGIFVGMVPYGMAIGSWADAGYEFTGWGVLDWLVGLIGAAMVAAGLLFGGFFFRFVPWSGAPLASLGVAVLSAMFIIATFAIFSRTSNSDDSMEVMLLQVVCILCLFVLSLPPFLHWLKAKRPVSLAKNDSGEVS